MTEKTKKPDAPKPVSKADEGKQEQDALKDKVQHPPEPKPNDVNPARPQDPEPDDMQTPKNFTPQGDAVPADPMLDPSAQQPFESYEDYQRRVGKPRPAPGVYDKTVTRGSGPA
jgi:hypothetical protein